MGERRDDIERHVKAGRTTKDEARAGDPGAEPPVGSYTDASGVSDLGVNEPVLPETEADAEAKSEASPTGMYAGETDVDRDEEDAVRQKLEETFPETRGAWKESGATPAADRDAGEE
jgi:hypothetical protein